MATVEKKPITAQEYLLMPDPPDGLKTELVRGEVVVMGQPGWEHGEIQNAIGSLLKQFLKQNPIGRVAAESGVLTERGPDTVRGPDLSFYSKERMPLDKRVTGYHDQPPDLCVEGVSPSNTRRQLNDKIKEYFFAGVRAVWVVDPEERSVTVYLEQMEGKVRKEGVILEGGEVLPGFTCNVAELFG